MTDNSDTVLEGLHEWKPEATEFVVLTKADWEIVLAFANVDEDPDGVLAEVETMPLTLEVIESEDES